MNQMPYWARCGAGLAVCCMALAAFAGAASEPAERYVEVLLKVEGMI